MTVGLKKPLWPLGIVVLLGKSETLRSCYLANVQANHSYRNTIDFRFGPKADIHQIKNYRRKVGLMLRVPAHQQHCCDAVVKRIRLVLKDLCRIGPDTVLLHSSFSVLGTNATSLG